LLFSSLDFYLSLLLPLLFSVIVFYLYKGNKLEKLFIYGLFLKIIFSYLYAFAYQYYFKEGDTFVYYENALQLRNLFYNQPFVYLKLIFQSPQDFNPLFFQYFNFNQHSATNFEETSEFLVSRIASVVMICTGKSYLNVSLFFSIFNYIISWNIFSILRSRLQVPNIVLLPILLWPTLLFWASGINKEIIYMPSLFLIFRFFLLRDFNFKGIAIFLLAMILLFIMKPFIGVFFLISLLLSYFVYRIRIWYQLAIILFSIFVLIVFSFNYFSELLNLVTIFQLAQKDATMVAGGTGYELNTDITSISGFLLLIYHSLVVTLFRPFIFEVNSLITFLLSIESLMALMLFIYVIWNYKKVKHLLFTYKYLILFLIIFLVFHSIIFGAISFNYGTLMRFKIIITPLYFSLLFFIIYKLKFQNV
jgi:hypothetical protein